MELKETNPYKKYYCPYCSEKLKLLIDLKRTPFWNVPLYYYKCPKCGFNSDKSQWVDEAQSFLERRIDELKSISSAILLQCS